MRRVAWIPGFFIGVLSQVPALAQQQQPAYTPQVRVSKEAAALMKVEAAFKKAEADLKKARAEMEKKRQGWFPLLTVGANISLGQSSNVVGRPDGTTVGLGATVSGRLDYKRGRNEWLNSLSLQLQQTRTPLVDSFVKTLDQFKIESTYLRSLESVPLGLYAGFTVETALFGGEDTRTAPVDYVILETDGTSRTDRSNRLLLTKELSPTLLTQGAGLNYKVLDRKPAKVTLRAGLSLVEALVRRGLAVADDAATPAVELRRLEDYLQAGGQIKIDAAGALNAWMTYGFTADFLFPLYSSVKRGLSGVDLISADIALKVGFKIAKWASLDYVLGVRRLPLLANVVQVWNGLLVSFAFNVIE
jgi:hypothetical protein